MGPALAKNSRLDSRRVRGLVASSMINGLHVRPLAAEQIPQVYPLVLLFDPDLSEEQWTGYASRLLNGTNGCHAHSILTVQTQKGYIYGLSVYWMRPDLQRGFILEIENFAVIDMAHGRTIARFLLQALEDLGRESGCSCVSIKLISPKIRRWLRNSHASGKDLFSAAGFHGDQLRLRKCF